MPVDKVNLLDKWKAAAWDFSTGHEEDRILKEKIAFIYDRLQSSFPAFYFVVVSQGGPSAGENKLAVFPVGSRKDGRRH